MAYYHQKSKQIYIEEDDFLKYAQTGDLILFQSSHVGGKLVRTATLSNYDHVAMIFRGINPQDQMMDQIYIFESVNDQGVRLVKWSDLRDDIGRGKWYHKAVYRSVDFNRKKKLEELLGFSKS